MKFEKQPLLYSEKIELLRYRGMLIPDAEAAERCLRHINYYRLSAYWLPFELPPVPPETRSHQFKPGTTFDQVIKIYLFDRKLRLLVMEAVGRIEVSLRARWAYEIAIANGSHAYLDAGLFRNQKQYAEDLANLRAEIQRSTHGIT